VSYDEGMQMAMEIGAAKYVECSAMTGKNVKVVFEEALRSVLGPPLANRAGGCTLL
jgi:Ras-related C3 botulinum toxin substrate 1